MENPVVITGENGVPFEEIVYQIKKRFQVGKTVKLDNREMNNETLHKIVEGFCFSNTKPKPDIATLLYPCYYPNLLAHLDQEGFKPKVLYIKANPYLRYRYAILWGQPTEEFANYEYANIYQKLLVERAGAVLDLDKVMENSDPLTLPDLTGILDRQLGKLSVHSSKVRSK